MASDSEEIEYQCLDNIRLQTPSRLKAPASGDGEDEDEDSEISLHEEQGFLVHMSPDVNKSQWNHVDDLDKFFTSVYDYHQRHGFQNMVLAEVLQILQFVFVVVFVTFLSWCVNYPELFDNIPHNTTHKKTFNDVIYSKGKCISRFNFITWFMLALCVLFLVGRAVKMVINFSNYLRTRNFFISALNIETRDLSNMTWHEVQARLLEVQKEEQICIHKQELTQLDIYHRILRFKNYLVALVNKNLLPVRFKLPLIGEHAVLTHGMRFNLDFILYWSPWSIFVNSYTMREEYRSQHQRKKLADQLSTHIAVLALLNLVLCPFIFFYQIVYVFFRYTEFVKRSPSFLGSRQWANYGRLYLRHFNELDHELNARLNRAYIPAKMYMNTFTSPSLTILAKYIAFFAGAPAAVLFLFGILDLNDVTKVEHLFTVASICGMVATVCSSLIPDENEVYCPERLMMSILAQIHYMPDQWKGRAHTSVVRDEFSILFQYKLTYILEELLSPLFTPFWLMFGLRPKSVQIVDFFRCFTVEVAGVGDVCSFAQMDIKKHGNPQWTTTTKPAAGVGPVTRSHQAENGKTELSLMHFTTTNPEWKPPEQSNVFIHGVKEEVQRELPALTSVIADPVSLPSLGYINPIEPYLPLGPNLQGSMSQHQGVPTVTGHCPKLRGGLSNMDGPLSHASGLHSSLTTSGSFHSANWGMNVIEEGQRELLSGNMSLSVLHMHEAHHRQRASARGFRLQSTEDSTTPTLQESAMATPTLQGHGVDQARLFPSTTHSQHIGAGPGAVGGSAMSDLLSSTSSGGSVIQSRAGPSQQSYHYTESTSLRQDSLGLPSGQHSQFYGGTSTLHPEPFPHPLYQGAGSPSSSQTDLSSLPPLGQPNVSFLPPSSFTPTSSGQCVPAADHMPQIREDASGEHEIDTSQSS